MEASIALVADNSLAFYVNGKSDGDALGDAGTQIMLGILPALFHPEPAHALVVGLGTGESAGWLAEVASMRQVDVVELEPAVDEMARRCAAVNFNVLEHPKVRRIYSDAREVLMTSRRRYDLIVSEPSNPYRAGVANLFTREFYRASRETLEPNGVFVQWLQAYEVDEARSASSWRPCAACSRRWRSGNPNAVICCSSARWSRCRCAADSLRNRLRGEPFRSALAYAWRVADLEGVLSRFVAGPQLVDLWSVSNPSPLNTDDHNVVEYGFARTVGDQTGFSVETLAAAARHTAAKRPSIRGDVDWGRVDDHRQVLRAVWHGDTRADADSRSHQQARSRFLQAYADADTRAMIAIWESARYELVFPTEVTLLGLGYADQADERARPLIERLRSCYPVEAAAMEAHLLSRQGQWESAADQLEQAFVTLRDHPWGTPHVVELCFLAAEDLSRQDRRLAPRMFAALAEPFAVYAYENERLTAVHGVAHSLGVNAVVETIQWLEPWVPWSERFLAARYVAYRATPTRSPTEPFAILIRSVAPRIREPPLSRRTGFQPVTGPAGEARIYPSTKHEIPKHEGSTKHEVRIHMNEGDQEWDSWNSQHSWLRFLLQRWGEFCDRQPAGHRPAGRGLAGACAGLATSGAVSPLSSPARGGGGGLCEWAKTVRVEGRWRAPDRVVRDRPKGAARMSVSRRRWEMIGWLECETTGRRCGRS